MRRHAGRPWFLSINLFDPHPPFDPPASHLARFDRAEMPGPVFAPTDLDHQRRLHEVDQQARVAVDPRRGDPDSPLYEPPRPRQAGANHDTPPETYDGKLVRACYHAMIALIDDMVGELMAVLDETGQRRDTIVLFMSDHGELLGDHGLIYKGCRFYEGLVRVPMIVSWPGQVREGVVSEALVELVDLPQTLLEAAGLPEGEGMQGKSLWPLLTGAVPAGSHKPYVLCEYFDALGLPDPRHTRGSMYFDGRWKLSVYHTPRDRGALRSSGRPVGAQRPLGRSGAPGAPVRADCPGVRRADAGQRAGPAADRELLSARVSHGPSGGAVPNPASAREEGSGATAGGREAAARGAVGRCPGSGPGRDGSAGALPSTARLVRRRRFPACAGPPPAGRRSPRIRRKRAARRRASTSGAWIGVSWPGSDPRS